MTTIVLLFSLGILLLVLEVAVPGGVLGIIGGLAMLAGCVLAFLDFGMSGGWLAVGVALLCLGLALYAEFVLLPKTPLGRRMFLRNSVDATSQSMPAEAVDVVGKMGETLTMMAPGGYVMIDGRRYEGRSRDGLIAKGITVRVVDVDNFQVIVSSNITP